MNYVQLPCQCGKFVKVAETDAGNNLPCACGRMIAVPSLRELRLQHGMAFEHFEEIENKSPEQLLAKPERPGCLGGVIAVGIVFFLLLIFFVFSTGASIQKLVGLSLILIAHTRLLYLVIALVPRFDIVFLMLIIPVIGPLIMWRFIFEHGRYTWWCVVLMIVGQVIAMASK